MQSLWNDVQRILRSQLGPQSFEIWLADVKPVDIGDDSVALEVPNRFYGDWILANYRSTLESAFSRVLGRPVSVRVRESSNGSSPTASEGSSEMDPQLGARPDDTEDPIPLKTPVPVSAPGVGRPNPDKTFANFVVGACNEFGHAASLSVADFPGAQHNPLFIFGGSGLGKTHLIHAIGNRILEQDRSARVIYLTAEQFVNEMIGALRFKRMPEFRERYRMRADVFLMDDIQFLGGKDRTQEEFFHTFEALQASGRQIVLTADMLPRDIPMLEDRLRTRCEGGLIADLQAPDLETKMAIIRSKAEELGLVLPEDVAQYIATGVNGNVREIEGALNRLAALAAFYQEPLSLDSARNRLRHVLSHDRQVISPEQIVQAVARFHNIKPADIRSASRLKRLVRPRQVAVFLIRELTDLSFPDIGRAIGGRDHSTIQYAYKKIKEERAEDPALSSLLDMIEKNLGR